ncbi:hypothetical protein GCM10017783_15770 [Deinococcus piscis]|uniref:Uncharacterized protein n=1 Tax=Deinococcus piscis TaxID=394230 RepID=A0ABQ3K5P8_9DEIO|nr:hypothetical protein [Deinococcus piscis]GHG04022.1 hypothetical protein GCM10017783_15770 [Deinococcus piscis]
MARRSSPAKHSTAKPRRTREKVETPAGFLATHDLKERGWTVRLIERYLGEHDSERPNGLKMGRRRLPPVKLYREDRVEAAEADEDFLMARSRAEDAREKRQAARERRERERAQLLHSAAESYVPRVQRLEIRKGAVKKAREPYLPQLERTLEALARELGGLKGGEEKALRAALLYRLYLALSATYEWYPHPDRQANQGKEAGKSKAASATKPTGREAKPSDWRDWDWDDA